MSLICGLSPQLLTPIGHYLIGMFFQELLEYVGFRRLMFEGPGEELVLTENTQPALMTHSLAVLRVRDRGLGIPHADLPRILDGYYRGRNAIGHAPGTGVGNGGVPGAGSGGGTSGVTGATSVERRYQLPRDSEVAPPLNRK